MTQFNIPSLFGWGTLIINDSMISNFVQFPNAQHTIEFEKVSTYHTSITGVIYSTGTKWRPIIRTLITVCDLNDIQNLAILVQIINDNDNGIHVTPQFNNQNSTNQTYQCYISSDFAPQHIEQVEAGQIIQLQFIGRYVDQIPLYYSHPQMMDMQIYGGDTIQTYTNDDVVLEG